MLMAFFSWWYGKGWVEVAGSFGPRLKTVSDSFSVQQLLRTLFAPWRRIISNPGRSLEDKLRAAVDNAFSRVIGFFVRLLVLLAATMTALVVSALTLIELIIWPLLPPAIPLLIILGVIG